jgi:beta-barrel assembly-enhancing protease
MKEGHVSRVRSRATAVLLAAVVATTGCAISQQQELEMGREYASQIDRELPLVHDAAAQRYLDALGAELTAHARRQVPWRFRLVNSDVVNAFAVPGGFIYINRGIVAKAANLSEFAGVLAHEIAHVEHRHGVEQMERAQTANAGLSLAYILLGRTPGTVERTAVGVGGNLWLAGHSREAENEADASAVDMLVAAGIHPRGLPGFFRTLLNERDGASGGGAAQWFSTHPTTEDRITNVQNMIARHPESRLRGLQTDSDAFQRFRRGVNRLPAAPATARR